MTNHSHDARIIELHSQGMSDREISRTIGACRSLVQRRRSGLGLAAIGNVGRPKDATAKPKVVPTPAPTPPGGLGGGVVKPVTQMDRFLSAFARVSYAKPEECERAKEAGRYGRMPAPPPSTPFCSSSLERC